MKARHFITTLLILICTTTFSQNSISNSQALFLYNFLKFIQWPENNLSDQVTICVYGNNTIYDELVKLTKGRMVGQQTILVKKVASWKEMEQAHLIFIDDSKNSEIKSIADNLKDTSCLIVSDTEGSNALGTTIELLLINNKLRFRINSDAGRSQNFVISQQLIRMSI